MKGFSLIEVLIAIALLGIIGIAYLSGLATATRALLIADERTTAESLARSQMEYVNNQDYDYADNQSYEQSDVLSAEHPNYTVSVQAQPLHDPTDDDGIQKITVTVKRNGKQVIIVEGYKVDQ